MDLTVVFFKFILPNIYRTLNFQCSSLFISLEKSFWPSYLLIRYIPHSSIFSLGTPRTFMSELFSRFCYMSYGLVSMSWTLFFTSDIFQLGIFFDSTSSSFLPNLLQNLLAFLLFIYLCLLHWVFLALFRLSPAAENGAALGRYKDFSLQRLHLLRSTDLECRLSSSGSWDFVAQWHVIVTDQGLNPRFLDWQIPHPLHHQGCPLLAFFECLVRTVFSFIHFHLFVMVFHIFGVKYPSCCLFFLW